MDDQVAGVASHVETREAPGSVRRAPAGTQARLALTRQALDALDAAVDGRRVARDEAPADVFRRCLTVTQALPVDANLDHLRELVTRSEVVARSLVESPAATEALVARFGSDRAEA